MYLDDFSKIAQKPFINRQPSILSRIIFSSIQLFTLKNKSFPTANDLKRDEVISKLKIPEQELVFYCDRYHYLYSMN